MSSQGRPVAIRAASLADAAAIARLITQLGYPAAAGEIGDRLAYWLPDPMSTVLVAEHGGRVIGSLSLHAVPYLERTGRWARIESLVIDEDSRGAGAGRALIAAAEQAARQWGCLTMEVTSSRRRTGAHAFYRQAGYRDTCDEAGRFLKPLGGTAGQPADPDRAGSES